MLMAALVLKRLCRRGSLNGLFQLRMETVAASNSSDGLLHLRMATLAASNPSLPSQRQFSALARQIQAYKVGHIASSGLYFAQPFRGLKEQAAGLSDTSPSHHVYEDADSQAAASAFQSHLQRHSQAYLSDAAAVVAHAPLFVKQLVDLVKRKSEVKVETVKDKPESKSTKNKNQKDKPARSTAVGAELSFEKQVLAFLNSADMNVLEPILESIGMGSDRLQCVLQKLTEENVDVQSFLFVIRWIQNLGFSRSSVGNIVEKETRVLSYKSDEIEVGFSTLKELSIPQEEILSLITRYPLLLKAEVVDSIAALRSELKELPSRDKVIHKSISDKPASVQEYKKGCADAVLRFLRSYGMTEEWLDRMLQRHFRLVFLDVEKNFLPTVKFLKDLGVSRRIISKVIKRSPGILFYNVEDNLMPRLEYFKSLGFREAEFAQMISRYPSIFSASLKNKIKPAVEELKTLGVTEQGLKKVMFLRPSLFAHKLGGDVSTLVSCLKESEYSDNQKVTAFIQLYDRGLDHRKNCEECLMKYGFSASEAKEVLDKEPEALGFAEKTLVSRLDFLTDTLGLAVQNVLLAPSYLSFGFRDNVFRRERVLAYMKSKGLLTEDVTLECVLSPSNEEFYSKFVKPHSKEDHDLGKIWRKHRQSGSEGGGLNFLQDLCVKKSESQVNL